MKIIHLTDIHIARAGERIQGLDPRARLLSALDHIRAHHADAERMVVTGDLAHWADAEAYAFIAGALEGFPVPPRLLLGNHDAREPFFAAFADAPRDGDGRAQWAEDVGEARFVYLDTTEPGTHAGRYGPDRRAWLEATLEEAAAAGRPCFLFMHHHPRRSHIRANDDIGLAAPDGEAFAALLARWSGTVAHVFFGHCHQFLSGRIGGVSVSGIRGTCHQGLPDFSGTPLLRGAPLSPAYGVVFLDADGHMAHVVDFTHDGPVFETGTRFEDWAR